MAKVSVNISREPGGVSRFRRLLPQIIASVACNFVLLDLNSCLGYPTVIIAQLRETQEIPLSKSHASWLGSIAYICQPFGSLSSGFLVEWLGRRRFMMLLNIPFLTGWLLMCFAPSFPVLVLASVIIGITIGLTEAPINSYIGEVCQPEIRGMMTACAGVFYQCGFFVEYLLGSLTTWRNTAGISAAIPIFTAIYIFLVPEAPIWLVSKGRIEEAESALCWLRGWVEPSVVKEELTELVRYHEETKKLLGSPSTKTQVGFSNPAFVEENRTDGKTMPTVANAESQDVNTQSWGGEMKDRLRDLIRPPTLRPLMLVIPFFFFVHFSGLTSIRPFMVEVFKEFDMPISGEWAASANPSQAVPCTVYRYNVAYVSVWMNFFWLIHNSNKFLEKNYAKASQVVSGGCGVVGTVLMMFTVHILGKRPLSLFCTAGSAFSAILLGVYALAAGAPHKEGGESLSLTWMPLLLFIVLSFCNSIVGQMPWMLLSEVFPFRTRGLSGGVSAAGCYVFLFLSSKTYLDVERSFSLAGGFLFYGAISCVGAVFLYFRLLETEGKSLEDIEQHFTQGRSARDAK